MVAAWLTLLRGKNKMKNQIIKSKLSINRSLNQLSHVQAMFLFCEPRNMGMDADIADNVIDLISKVRRELRLAQQELETVADSHLREEMTPATQAA